jgi:hypothetical protein
MLGDLMRPSIIKQQDYRKTQCYQQTTFNNLLSNMSSQAQSEARDLFAKALKVLHRDIVILQCDVRGLLHFHTPIPEDDRRKFGLNDIEAFTFWQPPLGKVGLETYQSLQNIANPIFGHGTGSTPRSPLGTAGAGNSLLEKVAVATKTAKH